MPRPFDQRGPWRSGALAVLALAVAACGSPSSPSPTGTSPQSRSPAAPSLSTAPGGSALPATTSAPPVSDFDPRHVAVRLDQVVEVPGGPLAVVSAGDGSGRLFVASQAGQVWIVRDGRRLGDPFLDVSGQITSGGERGLLGLAFHPDFPTDPRLFVDYTDSNGDTVVSSWRVAKPDAGAIDRDSEEVLLRVDQPYSNHNGGALTFGPDGMLYISLGDGGSAGDPQGNGQSLATHLAKILRIDVDKPSGGRPYGIPPDNPFVGDAKAKPEIWLTGLRNPWRISFDRGTGDLWIGDVGQGRYEEIDVVRAGSGGAANFGWNVTEGFHCYPSGEACAPQGLTPPITEYSHDLGCSVTGGNVYRGAAFPALAGAYLFADYCSGRVWAIDATASRVASPTVVLESGRSISSFGEDEAGELYATDLGGRLLRVSAEAR